MSIAFHHVAGVHGCFRSFVSELVVVNVARFGRCNHPKRVTSPCAAHRPCARTMLK